MSTEENKALVRRWEELWNQGNLALADELFAPTFILHDPSSPFEMSGPEGGFYAPSLLTHVVY